MVGFKSSNASNSIESKLRAACVLAVGVLTVCGPALAKTIPWADKWVEYKQVTVTKFEWVQPHSLIFFDVKDANGNLVHWVCETSAPQLLELDGWSESTLEPGDVVAIRLYPSKSKTHTYNGNPFGSLNRIVLADGTVLHPFAPGAVRDDDEK
jgi:hypothetical protein